jgi:hypothetical protein
VYDLGRAPSIHCLDLNKQKEQREKKKRKQKGKEKKIEAFPYHDV